MSNVQAVENSQAFCKKIKEYFANKKLPDCVIEISEKPFEEWVIHLTPTDETMSSKRLDLSLNEQPFISIHAYDGNTDFFFKDLNLVYLEVIETGEIVTFIDKTIYQEKKEELRKEFLELKKMLQGK